VEFGASWCSDCQELAKELDERGTRGYMQTHVDLVQVDVGRFDQNLDIARSMGIDLNQGIPATVFLSATNVPPVHKVGNVQILEYIHQLVVQLSSPSDEN
jgi:thioredoxin-like negative regulator of GroEL